jgi:hypothetical protein
LALNLTELSYVKDLLPEICWIALANRRLGYAAGVRLCSSAAAMAKESRRRGKFLNFALCSRYGELGPWQRQVLLRQLRTANLLIQFREVLEPLVTLYPECPLAFLGLPERPQERSALVDELRCGVADLIDKYATPSAVAQATVLHIRGLTGGLHYRVGLEPPDLNALVERPDSDEARATASRVRASVLHEIMPHGDRTTYAWSEKFWNDSLLIDTCRLEGPDDVS